MRPNIAELLTGVDKTIMSEAMPKVQQSGDMESLWELAAATRLMSFIENRWNSEYPRLATRNLAMHEIVGKAAKALEKADPSLAKELAAMHASCGFNPADLPSMEDLEKISVELMGGLEQFIRAHQKVADKSNPELDAVRHEIRTYLKQVNQEDFEAAQAVIFF